MVLWLCESGLADTGGLQVQPHFSAKKASSELGTLSDIVRINSLYLIGRFS
jgi:hypothetical protein